MSSIDQVGVWKTNHIADTTHVGNKDSREIYFASASEDESPHVPVGFKSLSISDEIDEEESIHRIDDEEPTHRIGGKTYASDIYNDKFTLHIDSLPHTKLYNGAAMWFKYVSTDPDIQYGVVFVNNGTNPNTSAAKRITFGEPYATEPKVFVCIGGFEISVEWYIHVHATDIDASGFTLHVDPRGAAAVHWAQVTWVSFSANRMDMTTGTFGSMENGNFNGHVTLTPALPGSAEVFYAISMFDSETMGNLGINMDMSDISPSGFDWNIRESGSGKNNDVGGSYLAVAFNE
jgi:H-type lectin domain